jgi:hypothetical protein
MVKVKAFKKKSKKLGQNANTRAKVAKFDTNTHKCHM